MMRQAIVIIILAFASQAHTRELVANHTAKTKDAVGMDKDVDKFVDTLVERVLKPSPQDGRKDLDHTALAKTSSRAWNAYAKLYRDELTEPSSTLQGGDFHPLTPRMECRQHFQTLIRRDPAFSIRILRSTSGASQ